MINSSRICDLPPAHFRNGRALMMWLFELCLDRVDLDCAVMYSVSSVFVRVPDYLLEQFIIHHRPHIKHHIPLVDARDDGRITHA